MLKIRLQRVGRINMPSYRLIVVEHTQGPKTGKFVEKVGSYNPRSKERLINSDRVKYWLSVGAKPSDTVHNMLVSLGIVNAPKINVLPKYVEPDLPADEAGKPVEEAPASLAEEPAEAEAPVAEEAPTEAPVEEPSGEVAAQEETPESEETKN